MSISGSRAPPGGCFGGRVRSALPWQHWGNGKSFEETFSQGISPRKCTDKAFNFAS